MDFEVGAKLNETLGMQTKIDPGFKPKSGGVIPAKKRLVKRMVFDCIAQWISCFGGSQSEKPCSCFNMGLTPTKSNAKRSKDE
ncbi:hypothetical protein CFP56_043813 [Quercus suber]|uniref:Uncharacterized protein n=1 Tax=Quercus suber TaxID=58331 RepID=A0AAW0LGR9_QUESU